MISQYVDHVVVPLALLIVLGGIPGLDGGAGPRPARAQTVTKPDAAGACRPAPSADEAAIRAVDEAFVRGYNKGDAKALSAMFTDDAEVVEANGARYQGRELVERSFSDTFAASKGARIAFEVAAIRFLIPDVAKEEGRSVVTPVKGPAVSRLYTVLFVKREGRWLIASVREEPDPLVRPHERLKDLEWMVGEWVDEAPDSVARFDCRWSEDGNFLIRSFTLKWAGKSVMTGTQRIGWDPLARQFRSWEFDSEGGFGEGRWSRDGDRWVVKHTAIRPEGMTVSATNIMTRVRPDMVRWVSIDRVLGDESVPVDDAYVLVRVPPPPRLGSKDRATSPKSPNTERNPR
jgi:uncharacterized protein (TIGR02246 family)